jgi:phosphotransferase system HPr-like phosphotransfer protein
MTTHLSESEFVEAAEETLGPRRGAHLEICAACRDQAQALRAILRETAAMDVPEPSPLFWEHMVVRVRDGIAEEPAADRFAWIRGGMRVFLSLGAAAAVVIAVFSGVQLTRAVRVNHTPAPVVALDTAVAPLADHIPETTDPANAEVWEVLTAAASGVEFQDAHDAGMHVRPAAIDHAVQDLSAAERTELGRLLQSELKRSSN